METVQSYFSGTGLNPWVYTSIIFALVLGAAMLVRHLVWNRLAAWARASEATWDDRVLEVLSAPATALMVVASFAIAVQSAPEAVRTHPLLVYGVKVAFILIAVWFVDRGFSLFFRSTALPVSITTTTRTLLQTIARALLFILALLVILDTVGVSITPLLASLGVGSVAVALALQDTLSNFFGGLYLLVDKPLRIGDFVEIEGVQGHVVKIGWRSTRILAGSNDTIVVPNSKVSSSSLKNFNLPDPAATLVVDLGVSYESDLQRVEAVTIEVAREVVMRLPEAVSDFLPVVRFTTFADSSINFSVVMRVKQVPDAGLVKHEFIKALHARFKHENIEIPFPQRVVHWNQPTKPIPVDILPWENQQPALMPPQNPNR